MRIERASHGTAKSATARPAVDRGTAAGRASKWYLAIPLAACVFALIVHPLLLASCSLLDTACLMDSRIENKIFWPITSGLALLLAYRNRARLTVPWHIACLLVYLALAGTSLTWAFNPSLSFIRFGQQVMVITAVVLPILVASRDADLIRGLFYCFAIAIIINIVFVLGPPPAIAENATPGHTGYFPGKNYLGECAAVGALLALYEVIRPGGRRIIGAGLAAVTAWMIFLSNSKMALGLVLAAPMLAIASMIVRRLFRVSLAALPVAIYLGYLAITAVSNFSIYRISYILFGESTFTGRRFIWDFANFEIARKPLLGWGYQSFWLVGPDAPSVVDAPGWIKSMPNAHNGYLDSMLELGYVGLVLLVVFVLATLHACGRLADRDRMRGWLVLSLAYFIILSNTLETTWMRGFEFLWLVFLALAAEIARHRLPARSVVMVRPVRAKVRQQRTRPRPDDEPFGAEPVLGPAPR